MNRFLFIMMLLMAGGAHAQDGALQVVKADTSQPNLQSLKNSSSWLSRATPSHKTSQGTVYIMPIDKMPCLVPNAKQTAPMPTMRPKTGKRMPNAFPALPWLPKGK